MVLIDLLRVWLPSLIVIYGSEDSTPAGQFGAFAAAWLVIGLLVVFAGRVGDPRWLTLGCAAAMAAGRLVVQFGGGGDGQLYAASFGVFAGIGWLVGTAMSSTDNTVPMVGLVGGIAAAVTLHTALRTLDLAWRSGFGAWVLVVAMLLGFLAVAWLAAEDRTGSAVPGEAGSPWAWFAVGPALLLVGVVTGSPPRAEAAAGWGDDAASLVLVAASGLAVLACLRTRSITRQPAVAALALVALVLLATVPRMSSDGVSGLLPPWAVWCQALAAVALGACLGWAGTGRARDQPSWRGWSAGAGMLALFTLTFLYYAVYDVRFLIPNVVMLLTAAALVGVSTVAGSSGRRSGASVWGHRPGSWQVPVALVACAAAAVGVAGVGLRIGRGSLDEPAAKDFPVRVMTYNVRMGYDLSGRFVPDRAADVIRAERPDLVFLNEVDRGWFVGGGHDLMRLLAEQTGMPYVFVPAADEVSGDGVLSRIPLTEVRTDVLSGHDVPTGAAVTTALLTLDRGRRLGIVATHLQRNADGEIPVPQADAVADRAVEMAEEHPVVVLGDFNAEPGSAHLGAFEPQFRDGLAAWRPVPTYPADHPRLQIDHVLVTDDLETSDLAVPDVTASDHRPVAVTVSATDHEP